MRPHVLRGSREVSGAWGLGLGFRVWGLGFIGFRVYGLEFGV